MIENILAGLILAGVSGITFIAYKHHSVYMKIYLYIHYGALCALVIGTAWNSAVDKTWIALHTFIKSENSVDALHACEILKIPFVLLMSATVGVTLYAYFLGHLHRIFNEADNEK
ncbi:MAG TPA: hypothetical protein VIE69_04725 [Methylophilaceae bacterium]|jgi:hypothetical protein